MISKIKEIYNYRELLLVFTKKELKVKYKNSALGFLWSFINPLIMAAVFTFIFSFVFPADIKHYPIFLLVALLPWNYFTTAIAINTSAIMSNANLIKKVSFPREIIPLSVVLSGLINFFLEMVVILIILLLIGYNFLPYIPVLVLAIVLQVIVTAGFGFLFASITVYFRDMEQLIAIILLVWFYATPVVYPLSQVANKSNAAAQALKILNPLTSIMLLYRQSLYYLDWPTLSLLSYAVGTSFSVFILGYYLFEKLSPNFAKEV